MASTPSARAPKPEAAPPPPPLAEEDKPTPPAVTAPISALGAAQEVAATDGKPSDVVKVYNRHVGRIAGIEPMSHGRVRRAMLDRFAWALRAV